MKKIGMMLLTGALLVTPSFAAFSDVDSTHWAYSAITKMEEANILSGYNDGSFKPSNNITLAEFAAIFTKIFEIPADSSSNYFIDIPTSHWAKSYVEAVREYINPLYDSVGEALGVTEYSYLKGLPGDIEMTREAFIYAVSRIYGYNEELYTLGEEKILFADYEEILYPKEVVLAYKNKVVSGEVIDGKVYIRPNRCITRAEASAIFRNLLKYENERVNNKNENSQLNTAFGGIIKGLKAEGVESSRNFIYDTQGVLKNEAFILSEDQIISLNELFGVVLKNFKYEILENGFYSFNRGYIKVRMGCYDVLEGLLSKEDTDLNDEVENIKKLIEKKKIKIIEKEEVFNFAKQNGEWKLILK